MRHSLLVGLAVVMVVAACKSGSNDEPRDRPVVPKVTKTGSASAGASSDGGPREAWSVKLASGLPAQAVAVLPKGGACVTGMWEGALELGGKQLTAVGDEDGFVACYGPGGAFQWSQILTGPGRDSFVDVAVDAASGDVFVLGSFGGLDERAPAPQPGKLAGVELMTAGGGSDMVVARFHGDGTPAWVKSVGGPGGELDAGLAVGAEGRVMIVGTAYGELEVAGTKLGKKGGQDGFAIALSGSDGTPVWAVSIGGHVGVNDVAIGVDGVSYVVGYYLEALAVGGTKYPVRGDHDGFLVAISATGAVSWVQTIGGPGREGFSGVAVNGRAVYAVGWFEAAFDILGKTYTPKGGEDGFVMKLALDGTPLWFQPWGGDARDDLKGVAIGTTAVIAVGATGGEQHVEKMKEVPGVPVTVLGPSDAAVVALLPTGQPAWSKTFGGKGRDWATGVAADGDTVAYVVGKSDERGFLRQLLPGDR